MVVGFPLYGSALAELGLPVRLAAWLSMLLFVGVATAEVYASRELHFRGAAASGIVDHYLWELGDGTRVITQTNEIKFIPKARTIEQVRFRAVAPDGTEGKWSEKSNAIRIYALPGDGNKDGRISAPDHIILSHTFGDVGWDVITQSPLAP